MPKMVKIHILEVLGTKLWISVPENICSAQKIIEIVPVIGILWQIVVFLHRQWRLS